MRAETKRILEYFKGRQEVIALFLFGTFDTPRERSDSDIDLGVLVRPEEGLGSSIEKVRTEYYNASPGFSMRTVDIVILNAAPPFLKYQILKTGRV